MGIISSDMCFIHVFQAMYEGILVDLPFATFFLSKLKEKYISPSFSLKQVATNYL
jgi:hypothetical protein